MIYIHINIHTCIYIYIYIYIYICVDKQIVGTRGGLNGRKLKKEPARRSISARWEPCGKVLARIKYRPPDRLADLIQKVIIEEILVCPAAEYTDITTLLLQRLIRDWGARTRWIQINKVTLGKRNWLWQAIQSASTNTSSGFYVEGDQYANATQVRLGKLRNAFRRHVTVPVRLMPSDSPKWPKGIKGTGYTADYLKPITDIQKARVRKKKILRKLHKKKFHGVN
ncbi:hypothetical protein AAMO2058_000403900 [Amorphochlora amoebiformis]